MMQFVRIDGCPQVYAPAGAPDAATLLVTLAPAGLPETLCAPDALTNACGGAFSFVFLARPVDLADVPALQQIVQNTQALIAAQKGSARFLLWQACADGPVRARLALEADGSGLAPAADRMPLHGPFFLTFDSRVRLSCAADTVCFDAPSNRNPVAFDPAFPRDDFQTLALRLPLDGPQAGCLQFRLHLRPRAFETFFSPGFAVWMPGAVRPTFFPLIRTVRADTNTMLSFAVSLLPGDPENEGAGMAQGMADYARRPSRFDLLEVCGSAVQFETWFTSLYGESVVLQLGAPDGFSYPSRFVFTPFYEKNCSHMAPEGEFALDLAQALHLQCGFGGGERIVIQPGGRMCFLSRMPAVVPKLAEAAPARGTLDQPAAEKLIGPQTTAWAGCSGAPPALYSAQPAGLPLYAAQAGDTLLHHNLLPVRLSAETLFPLLPYAGAYLGTAAPAENLPALEQQVIAPVRRARIPAADVCGLDAQGNLHAAQTTVTTPSGITATLVDGAFRTFHLGGVRGPDGTYEEIALDDPDPKFIAAFQSGALFLVIANPEKLGTPLSADGPRFRNQIHLQDWLFRASVGAAGTYGDYQGIMLVKGRAGRIYDPADDAPAAQTAEKQSLAGNLTAWTMRADFSAPCCDGAYSPTQQPQLSSWLMAYCRTAWARRDEMHYAEFCRIITDPSWQGVLFLNMPLTADNLPASMRGLIQGASGRLAFHHWGISLTPVRADAGAIEQQEAKALFGLIDYRDAQLEAGTAVHTVAPGSGDYEFKLLTLRVLFAHAAVASCECSAQLNFETLFDSPVLGAEPTDGPYHAALMQGSYQEQDGAAVFRLENQEAVRYTLNNAVLHSVTLTRAAMNSGSNALSFDLSGRLGFAEPKDKADVFSYGFADGTEYPLVFSGCTLSLTEAETGSAWRFDVSGLSFQQLASRPRPGSLCGSMPILPTRLLCGDAEHTIAEAGFAPLTGGGLDGGGWIGLYCACDLGTVGALADKAGLSAAVLLAWATGAAGKTGTGCAAIHLPGITAGGLPIQGLLNLTAAHAALEYDQTARRFFLRLSDLAVRVLGVAKLPPEGKTDLLLFGAPDQAHGGLCWYCAYRKKGGS